MKHNPQILAATVAVMSVTSVMSNAFAAPVPLKVALLPINNWQVKAQGDDKVTLKEEEGCIRLNFDVDVNKTHQQGYQTFNRKTFDVVLKQAVALPQDADRVVYESLGNEITSGEMPQDAVQLWPLIRDAKGEVLAYVPKAYPTLSNGSGRWSRAMTAGFYAGEAGGATSDIYEASGGDVNSWPDGQLSFLGFRVIVQKPAMGHKSGMVALGEIQVTRGALPVENPYLYADAVLKDAGRYRFAGEVATDFQTLPVRSFEQVVDFIPQSLAGGRQRLTVPLGQEGDYWISYALTSANGDVLSSKDLRFHMTGNVGLSVSAPITAQTPPTSRYLLVNPDRAQGGVYPAGEPIKVALRVFPKGKTNLKVKWRLLQYAYDTEIEDGEQTVQANGAASQDIDLSLKGQPGRDAYRLKIEVLDGTTRVDQQEYVLGYHTDLTQPRGTRNGKAVDRAALKQSAYYRCTYLPPEGSETLQSEDAAVAHFEKIMVESGDLARNWTYMLDVAQMEILPGVYDFSLLDRIMDAAADHHVALTLRVAHVDSMALFRWAHFSRQHSYDGLEIPEPFYGGFAVTDPRYLELWHRLNRALFDRYKNHRAFQGYYLMQPAGEATVQDKPWQGIVAGYEKPSVEAFQAYLQKELSLSLHALNVRWKTGYKSWDEVLPPAPTFQLGAAPDLRPAWIDFSNFKIGLDTFWFREAVKRIRAYDPNRVIIVYTAPTDRQLFGQVDYFHNGGNHFLQNQGAFVDAWKEGGAGWINEPHHPTRWAAYGDPSQRGWVLDWTVWVGMAQAGGGSANMHIYYTPNEPNLISHYGNAYSYDRFQKFKPILDELQKLELQNPITQVATLQSKLTLATKHRTTFAPRLEDLKRWFELLDVDSISRENLRADHAANYKLVLPNILDEVMADSDIALLDKTVRENGAKMLISANTGKFSPAGGTVPFQLLQRLGITPPSGAYIQNEVDVVAQSIGENPLFEKNQSIPFYTLAQLQKDVQSRDVQAAFWKYPYRWIPQTDYFGFYRDNKTTNGEVLARFATGGVAVSRHRVGKGEVVVFWGTPDYRPEKLGFLMARAASWAGVQNPRAGNPIPLMIEGKGENTGRHYALLFQETPGHYVQRIPTAPDGQWFVDDMVSDRRLGTFSGQELREKGVPLDYLQGASPLQIVRMIPMERMQAEWLNKPGASAENGAP